MLIHVSHVQRATIILFFLLQFACQYFKVSYVIWYAIINFFAVGFEHFEETDCFGELAATVLERASCCSSRVIQSSSVYWIDDKCHSGPSRLTSTQMILALTNLCFYANS